MEIDLDIHAWAYLARKAFSSYIPRLGTVVFENAFVVQVGIFSPGMVLPSSLLQMSADSTVPNYMHTLQDTLTVGIPHMS